MAIQSGKPESQTSPPMTPAPAPQTTRILAPTPQTSHIVSQMQQNQAQPSTNVQPTSQTGANACSPAMIASNINRFQQQMQEYTITMKQLAAEVSLFDFITPRHC
jgi:hypothetical protein